MTKEEIQNLKESINHISQRHVRITRLNKEWKKALIELCDHALALDTIEEDSQHIPAATTDVTSNDIDKQL